MLGTVFLTPLLSAVSGWLPCTPSSFTVSTGTLGDGWWLATLHVLIASVQLLVETFHLEHLELLESCFETPCLGTMQ